MLYKQAQIEKYLKKPDLTVRCWLIYGANDGLIHEYVKNLTASVCPDIYDPFQVVYLNCDDVLADPGVLISEFNSQSLMGGRRVIVIKDADNNLTKHLKSLFENTKSDTLLIVFSTSLNKKSSLVKLAEDAQDFALVACYEDRDEDIYATVKSLLSQNNLAISNDALQLLCARLSNDRKSNLGEIEKLITYMGDAKSITLEDIDKVISDTSSSSTDDVCFCAASGMKDKTLQAFQKLVKEGTDPAQIIRSLVYHFNRLLTCVSFMENGETLDKAVLKLVPRVIFFRENNFKRQLMLWNKERIFSVLELLYKSEKDTRTNNMPVEDVVSYLLMQISSAAANAAAKLNQRY